MAKNYASKFVGPNGDLYHYKDEEAQTNIGNVSALKTTDKTNVVSAINELKDRPAVKFTDPNNDGNIVVELA